MGKLLLMFVVMTLSFAKDGFLLTLFDEKTKKPIEEFRVVVDNKLLLDLKQKVIINGTHKVEILAPGYQKMVITPQGSGAVYLKPFVVKGIYLSNYGVAYKPMMDNALAIIKRSEINALVIDIKNENGMMTYAIDHPMVNEIGANEINTLKDIKALLAMLKENNIYAIARIATYKDQLLATKKTKLSIKTKSGKQFLDKQNVPWSDPFAKEVRDYNIAIGVEAAKAGFDEVQYDYVRFPDATDFATSKSSSNETVRTDAIASFLGEAREKINMQGAFVSADIFGYVLWQKGDMGIGQKLEKLIDKVDYLSPMLYPSGFTYGIPNYKIPTANSYEIVHLSLKETEKRVPNLNKAKLRPWLQAFKDYGFDRREYKGLEVYKQIKATKDFSPESGYLFWNPRNRYDLNLFDYKPTPKAVAPENNNATSTTQDKEAV